MATPEHAERGVVTPDWHTNYTVHELESFVSPGKHGTTPEAARDFLLKNGYSEDMWDEIIMHEKHSHEIRSEIIIARGSIPRLDYVLRIRMRLEDGTLDRQRWPDDSDLMDLYTPAELEAKGIEY